MNFTRKVAKNRKFHDAWAFVVYAIITSVIYFFLIKNIKMSFLMQRPDYKMLGVCAGYIVSFGVVITLMLLYSPKPLMHFSFFAAIAITLYSIIDMKNKALICYTFIQLIFGITLYFTVGYHSIAFTSIIMKDSARMFVRHCWQILLVKFVAVSVHFVHVAAMRSFYTSSTQVMNMRVVLLGHYLWTGINTTYFFSVFTAGITSFHVLARGNPQNAFLGSLVNAIFALGSICLGGLLLAIARALQWFIEDDRKQRSMLMEAIQFFVLLLLYFVDDAIDMVNDWALPYVALFGTSFKKSIRESFTIIKQQNNQPLKATLCINVTMFFLMYSGVRLLNIIVCKFFGATDLFVLGRSKHMIWSHATQTVFFVFVMSNFLEIFSSISKTIMFLHSQFNRELRVTLPDSEVALTKASTHQTY